MDKKEKKLSDRRERLQKCHEVLAEMEQGEVRDQFELIEDWAKIRHIASGHELLPDQVKDFIATKL